MTPKLNKLLYTALAEVGVKEKKSNNVVYNTWYYGREVNDSAGTGAYAWCVVFLSWCAHQAGLSGAIPKENNVSDLMEHYKALGRFTPRDGHIPEAGDIVFFRTSAGRHVGLVLASNGTRVKTVEGNTSDAVMLRDYSLSDGTIVGWGVPDYEGAEAAGSEQETVEAKEVLTLMELKQGDWGEAVRALQIRLLYEGYDLGSFGSKKDGADGEYGAKTRAAVTDYQKKQGLTADGIAGVQTLSRLYGLD